MLELLKKDQRILFYGIGNLARQDDGLGIRFIERLEELNFPKEWALDANYQLNAEIALQMCDFDKVFFVDAYKGPTTNPNNAEKYFIKKILPNQKIAFSTHAMSAESLLGLCENLYQKSPLCFHLAIPGNSWDFGENLSDQAQENLIDLLKDIGSVLNA